MSQTPPESKAADTKQMTAAQAAKEVRRTVIETVDSKDTAGNPIKVQKPRKIAVEAAEVLSFADLGTHVVVVTRDGQKFSSADA